MLGVNEAAPSGPLNSESVGDNLNNAKNKMQQATAKNQRNKENRQDPGDMNDSSTADGDSSENESSHGADYVPLTQPGRPPRREYLERTLDCRWEGCGKTFATVDEARNHEQVHGVNEEDFMTSEGAKCLIRGCHKIFPDPKMFKKHIQLHRPPHLQCNMCGKKFHEAAKLRRHELVHSGDKPFTCDVCGKEFAFKANLKTHQRVHTGERPFKCNFPGCTRTFAQASNRNAHMQVHMRGKSSAKPEETAAVAAVPEPQIAVQHTSNAAPVMAAPSVISAQTATTIASADTASVALPPTLPTPKLQNGRIRSASASLTGGNNKRMKPFSEDDQASQILQQPPSVVNSLLGTSVLSQVGPAIRSGSPFVHTFGTPFGMASSSAILQTSSAFTPIQRPISRQFSGASSQGSQGGSSSNERDNSLLYQLAQLSAEAIDGRANSGSPLMALSPIGFASVPLFPAATPLCFMPTSNVPGSGSHGVTNVQNPNNNSTSSGFTDSSILYSSLNHSLASNGSSSSNGWLPQCLDEGSLLTPHVVRFTPDAMK